jgi:RPA family protein
MAQLIIEVDDEIAKEYGLASLKDDLDKIIETRKLQKFAKEYHSELQRAGINDDEIWKMAKKAAFAEFKEKHLKNIIP